MTPVPTPAEPGDTGTEDSEQQSAGAPHGRLAPLLPRGEPVESLLRKAQFFTAER